MSNRINKLPSYELRRFASHDLAGREFFYKKEKAVKKFNAYVEGAILSSRMENKTKINQLALEKENAAKRFERELPFSVCVGSRSFDLVYLGERNI